MITITFHKITRFATYISIALWICAASFLRDGSPASFAIIAILASLAQIIAIRSAWRDGIAKKKLWLVDDVLDEVKG